MSWTLPIDLYAPSAREVMAEVVRKHADDVFAHIHYLSYFHEYGHEDVIARYRAAMQAHPGVPIYELYYAASLIGNNTTEALRRLEALTRVKDFPYPDLLIGQIRTFQRFADHVSMSEHLIRFADACPEYLPTYELLSAFGSGDGLKRAAERLRRILTARTDRDAMITYRWLWPIEFRVSLPAEYEAIRTRIEQDLERFRQRYSLDDPVASGTFAVGYRLSGNTAALNSVPVIEHPNEVLDHTVRKWYRDHPRKPNGSKDDTEAYYRELAQAALDWIARWPDEPMPRLSKFQALAALPQTSNEELTAAAATLIEINRRRPRRYLTTPAVILVARTYVERDMKLEEIPGMLTDGIRQADATRRAPESDLFDDSNHRMNEEFRYQARIEARAVEFEWALKTSRTAAAAEALAEMRQDLDHLARVARQPGNARYLDSEYWAKMARLAELEGDKENSEAYRRRAEQSRKASPRNPDPPALASLAGKVLPPLRATGMDGLVWTSANINGKVVVMNLWATWCAPCVEELPHFQKLYEALKDKPNVVVIALNVDSNPGVVGPFLKGRGFTFPVVLGFEWANQLIPGMGIPRNWVIFSGTIRNEQIGFSDPEKWLKGMLAKVDEAERERPTAVQPRRMQ